METAGAAALGGLGEGGKADLSGQPCRNCGVMVDRRHCPACGQLASSFHRPFLGLIVDSFSDAFAFDSRISRTLPLLLFRPGALTKHYIAGKRARYVPPFRLFLLSSLVFYLVGFTFLHQVSWLDDLVRADVTLADDELTEEQLAAIQAEIIAADGTINTERLIETIRETRRGPLGGDAETEANDGEAPDGPGPGSEELVIDRFEAIQANPKLFMSAIETWTPRLSLLLVPLTVLTFAILHVWRRRIYVYDHAIHALHVHSWMYISATCAMILSLVIGQWAVTLFFLIMPIYVTLSLRNAYGSNTIMSILRFFLLQVSWGIGIAFLVIGVLLTSAFTV